MSCAAPGRCEQHRVWCSAHPNVTLPTTPRTAAGDIEPTTLVIRRVSDYRCVLPMGELFAWGDNTYGQLAKDLEATWRL